MSNKQEQDVDNSINRTLENLSIAQGITKEVAENLGRGYQFLYHSDSMNSKFRITFDSDKKNFLDFEFSYSEGNMKVISHAGGDYNGIVSIELGDPNIIRQLIIYCQIVKNMKPKPRTKGTLIYKIVGSPYFWIGLIFSLLCGVLIVVI